MCQKPGSCLNFGPVFKKTLSQLLEVDDLSMTVCPVRALECYFKRSHPAFSIAFSIALSVRFD